MAYLRTMAFLLLFVAQAWSAEKEETYKAMVGNDGVQHVDIVGGSYFFKPSHIILKVNVPVELKVHKESGIVPHNFAMKSPEAGMAFEEELSTEPKLIAFTPTKTGVYPFFCTKKPPFFKSHRERGMEGKIEVVD